MLLAADCVYDNDITDAFMAAAATLLQPCVCARAGGVGGCGALSSATGSSRSGSSEAYGCHGSGGAGENVGGCSRNTSGSGVSGANSVSGGPRSCIGPSSSTSSSKGDGRGGSRSVGDVMTHGRPAKCLYVALEKRWNFTLRNLVRSRQCSALATSNGPAGWRPPAGSAQSNVADFCAGLSAFLHAERESGTPQQNMAASGTIMHALFGSRLTARIIMCLTAAAQFHATLERKREGEKVVWGRRLFNFVELPAGLQGGGI